MSTTKTTAQKIAKHFINKFQNQVHYTATGVLLSDACAVAGGDPVTSTKWVFRDGSSIALTATGWTVA